ncbi:MAG: ABC transporter permease subunit [Alphaproteobacteria bacterium]|nr:ABC transporter permease subunit [Alphaproteobacteria bacterium]
MRTLYLLAWTVVAATLALAGCGDQHRPINGVEDLREARIGVMTGSTGEAAAKERFPQADIKSFDDIMDAVAAVKSGQLDAIVTAYPTAVQVSKKNAGFRILDERLTDENTSIAIRKGNPELLAAVNRIISDLRADGTLADMKRRWLKPDLSPYEELDIKLPTEGKPLRIGVAATREPFSFVDKDGRVTGHDGELARLIAARLGRPIQFYNMKFMALIPALQSGKVDMIVTGMTATDERRKYVDFTQSYFANAQVVLTRKTAAEAATADAGGLELTSPADLAGKRIGVLLGSAQVPYAQKNYAGATLLQYQNFSDLVLGVTSGKVDAALYDEDSLHDVLRDNPQLGTLKQPLFSSDVAAGFNKGNGALRDRFNAFLAQIRANGVYDDMVDRWITRRQQDMPDIPMPDTDDTLTIGTTDGGFPFETVKNNELAGFDIEMGERFAASLGKRVKFANMEFGALIAAVASGKVDMITASIFITPERQKRIDFSDPYYKTSTLVLALKSNIAGSGVEAASAPTRQPGFLESVADSFQSNIIHEKRYLLILEGLKVTVIISVLATLLGTALGALICFMRMSGSPLLNVPAKGYISVLRGMPVLVLLMLIYYVAFASVNISPVLVAVIAFGMNFAAYVSEMYRTGIESIDRGQSEAGVAMGFTRVQAFVHIVLPQAVQRILPVYKGEFISLVKMTSIVGYIAVQDLTKASDIIRSRTFDAFFPLVMVAILYFLISWGLMQFLGHLERTTDPKRRRRKARRAS